MDGSWIPKSIKNRSKNEFNIRRHPGIDFGSILVDLGRQVGVENRPKIDPKRHRKSDEKKKGHQDGKKSAPRASDPPRPRLAGLDPGKRVGGRVNPSRGKGKRDGRKGKGHLKPRSHEGWWD